MPPHTGEKLIFRFLYEHGALSRQQQDQKCMMTNKQTERTLQILFFTVFSRVQNEKRQNSAKCFFACKVIFDINLR